jgi:hypothetical protein
LIRCQDVAAYDHVTRLAGLGTGLRRMIPIFAAEAAPLLGLPADTAVTSYEVWCRSENGIDKTRPSFDVHPLHAPKRSGQVCVSFPDPYCEAVSRLLCKQTGKTLSICSEPSQWEQLVRDSVLDPAATSLTFVLPLWRPGDRGLDPTWLARTLSLVRQLWPETHGPTWGILTGPDENSLSLLASKAVLQNEIIARYRDAPVGLVNPTVTRRADGSPNLPLPSWPSVGQDASLQFVDVHELDHGMADRLAEQAWSMLMFQGHGRSYCACKGFLCGARRLDESPDLRPAQCVLGFTCADPAWLQVDPRRYDSPILVLDTCGAANWGSAVWQTGIPSLGFFALAGAASAVIVSDGVTTAHESDLGWVDMLHALSTGATIGECTALLNRARRNGNVSMPYFLLGDPDIVAGPQRWPNWAARTAVQSEPANGNSGGRWKVHVPASAPPFARFSLLSNSALPTSGSHTLHVWTERPGEEELGCRVFDNEDDTDVWVAVSDSGGIETTLLVERRATTVLPPELVEAAMTVPQSLLHWNLPHDPDGALARLARAAAHVVDVDQLTQDLAGSAVGAPPEQVDLLVRDTLAEWIESQIDCLRAALTRRIGGLWPFSFWPTLDFESLTTMTPCPNCGLTPTVRRSYRSAPGFNREWWECMRCDLVLDRPTLAGYPWITLRAPDAIRPGETIQAELTLDHSSGGLDCFGAGSVVVEQTTHDVTSVPDVFPIRIRSGDHSTTVTTLSLPSVPRLPQLYRLRGLVLLNARWFWVSRPLFVLGSDSCETNLKRSTNRET